MADITRINNDDPLDAAPVDANFQELGTNITNSNISASAAISASKLDLTNINSDISFDNTIAVEFQNAAGTDDIKIFENASDHLEVHLNTIAKKLQVTDSTNAEVFRVDTSAETVDATKGYKLQAWDSTNVDYAQLYHDGTNAILDTNAGGLFLGTTVTVDSGFLRVSNNGQIVDINHDGANPIYTTDAGVHTFDTAVYGNGAYVNYSDKRLKKNIKTSTYGLAEILKLKPKKYERKERSNGVEVGLIAQDVEKVIPEAVFTDKDGVKAIAYEYMIPTLINAVQELAKA